MGGSFDSRTYSKIKYPTREKVEAQYKEDQADSAYENGHSYSGCIGVMPPGIEWRTTKATTTEAEAYITEHHSKWDKAWGVECDDEYIVGGWCSS